MLTKVLSPEAAFPGTLLNSSGHEILISNNKASSVTSLEYYVKVLHESEVFIIVIVNENKTTTAFSPCGPEKLDVDQVL